jgi:hypothetical protein
MGRDSDTNGGSGLVFGLNWSPDIKRSHHSSQFASVYEIVSIQEVFG